MTIQKASDFGDEPTALDGAPLKLGPADRLLRAELLSEIARLHARGALAHGGAANASIRLPDSPDTILVTARGLPTDIGEDDFGIVTLDGEFVAGRLGKGVRSVVEMHTHAYRRQDVGAVFHTHSTHATAFAVAHKPIPVHYEPLRNRGQRVDVPVTPYGDRNSGGLVNSLDAFIGQHPETNAVLLANHGLLVFSDTPSRAADLVIAIEETAALVLLAERIGGSKPLA